MYLPDYCDVEITTCAWFHYCDSSHKTTYSSDFPIDVYAEFMRRQWNQGSSALMRRHSNKTMHYFGYLADANKPQSRGYNLNQIQKEDERVAQRNECILKQTNTCLLSRQISVNWIINKMVTNWAHSTPSPQRTYRPVGMHWHWRWIAFAWPGIACSLPCPKSRPVGRRKRKRRNWKVVQSRMFVGMSEPCATFWATTAPLSSSTLAVIASSLLIEMNCFWFQAGS